MVDPLHSVSGPAPICLPRDGERKIFQGAISIRRDDWEEHQPICDTVVTVYESSGLDSEAGPINDDVQLRAAVYYSKLAAYSEVSIKGFDDLRQVIDCCVCGWAWAWCYVSPKFHPSFSPTSSWTPNCCRFFTSKTRPFFQVVGALHQALAHEWRHQPRDDGVAGALFNFIFHHRAMIVVGTWDGDRDGYVEHGTDFTVLLKRSRLYRSFKQTPVHLSGVQDAQANAHQLIDDASRRGMKVCKERSTYIYIYGRVHTTSSIEENLEYLDWLDS